uniref:C2H2-type domain-containing protein n=1 Tax=Neogobius melanostomus TaxID=47308 RepID=A0A8C6U8Q1_9GOBI
MEQEEPVQKLPIPRLPPSSSQKKYRQFKSPSTKLANRRMRGRCRIYIGETFNRWRELRNLKGFKSDEELAKYFLDSYQSRSEASASTSSTSKEKSFPRALSESYGSSESSPIVDEASSNGDEDSVTDEVQNGVQTCPQFRSFSNVFQPGSIEVTLEPEQTEVQLSEPEEPAQNDEVSEFSEEEEGAVKRKSSSDEDWVPVTITEELIKEEIRNGSSEEDSGGDLERSDGDKTSSSGRKLKQLCTDCGALYGARTSHTCQHKLKPHVCDMCGRRYATETSLKIHSKAHTDNSEHRCWCCYAVFKTKQEKDAHKQIHKNQSKPYQCRHCPSSFAIFAERTKHNKIHRGPFEYKCDICGISFWVKAYLERHMMVHTGVKPYKCLFCGRGFNQDCNLRSHMRMHTGEKPYACPHCDKAFNHNVSLKSHVQRYHPSESETRGDTSCVLKNRYQEHSETGPGSGDDVQKQDTEQKQQETVLKPKFRRRKTGRPLGRPKRLKTEKRECSGPKSAKQNTNSNDDSSDEDFPDENNEDVEDVSFDLMQGKIIDKS